MADALHVVQEYMQAIGRGDTASARKCMHSDFWFKGPIDTFRAPEPYLEALAKLHKIVKRVEMKKVFVDRPDVCALYDLVTNTPAGTAFVAEWYRVKEDRIASIQVVFDARPFAAMFGEK